MSKYYYSPSSHSFLVDDIHKVRPDDCVQISLKQYSHLVQKSHEGMEIIFDAVQKLPVAVPKVIDTAQFLSRSVEVGVQLT